MTKTILISIACILQLLIGCNQSKTISLTADISRLDDLVRSKPDIKPFADSVKQFYKAIQKKDWEKTYEYRTNDFKQSINLDLYLQEAKKSDESWKLDGYKVLDAVPHSIQGHEPSVIRLIMMFQEFNNVSYEVVWWVKEEGSWHCLNAGPFGPSPLSMLLRDRRIANYLLNEFK